MIRIGDPVEVKSRTYTNTKGMKMKKIKSAEEVDSIIAAILNHNRATRRDRDDYYLIRDNTPHKIHIFSQYENKIIKSFKSVDRARKYIARQRKKHDSLASARYYIIGNYRKYDIEPIWEYCPILEATTDELEGYNIYVFVDGVGYLLQVIRREKYKEDKRHFTKIMQDIVLSDIVCSTGGELTFALADEDRTTPPFEWKVIYPNGRVEEPELFWDMLETLRYKANLDDWGYLKRD